MMQNRNGEVLNLDIGKGRLEDGSEVWMMCDIRTGSASSMI